MAGYCSYINQFSLIGQNNNNLAIILATAGFHSQNLQKLDIFKTPYIYMNNNLWETKKLFETFRISAYAGTRDMCEGTKIKTTNINPTSNTFTSTDSSNLLNVFLTGNETNGYYRDKCLNDSEVIINIENENLLYEDRVAADNTELANSLDKQVTDALRDRESERSLNTSQDLGDIYLARYNILISDNTIDIPEGYYKLLRECLLFYFFMRNILIVYTESIPWVIKDRLATEFNRLRATEKRSMMSSRETQDIQQILNQIDGLMTTLNSLAVDTSNPSLADDYYGLV